MLLYYCRTYSWTYCRRKYRTCVRAASRVAFRVLIKRERIGCTGRSKEKTASLHRPPVRPRVHSKHNCLVAWPLTKVLYFPADALTPQRYCSTVVVISDSRAPQSTPKIHWQYHIPGFRTVSSAAPHDRRMPLDESIRFSFPPSESG